MTPKTVFFSLFFSFASIFSQAQTIEPLRDEINQLLKDKSATVAVAIQGTAMHDTLSINADRHMPMQSVFKFHLALAVLEQIDQGKLSLDHQLSFNKNKVDRYQHLYSPLREKYPQGANVSVAELLKYTVSLSDNLGCDLLFQLVGGPEVVQSYLHQIGIKDIAIVYNELLMQSDWSHQYQNWTTAHATNQLLQLFFENRSQLLSTENHQFLLDILKGTTTGKKSIRGLLPKDAVVAHKTGHSGKNEQGLTGALNDIGIVFLPNGSYFYLSILVSDSMEDNTTNQQLIAQISKLAWDYFLNKEEQ